MKSNTKLNFNINKDDENINDYLFAYSELGHRPSKISMHGYLEPVNFLKYLEKFNTTEVSIFTDFIPNEDVPVINKKYFIDIGDNIYLSYTHLDKLHEDSFIGDISLFYSFDHNEKVDNIVNEISEFLIYPNDDEKIETKESNLKILNLVQTGFELEQITEDEKFEDIELYYEQDVLKKTKKVISSIKNQNKGLTIICGERGCGKTNLLSYIISKSEKNSIFIPCNLIDNSINNPEFRKFLKSYKDSLLVLDDVELYFSQMYSKSTFFTNNLLQLLDSIYSNALNLNIILSLNCNLSEIDKTLLESNNIIDVIELGKLSKNKIEDLSEHLGKKVNNPIELKLSEVLKNSSISTNRKELGFK